MVREMIYTATHQDLRNQERYHILALLRRNREESGWSVSLQSVVRASHPESDCGRREASATVWRETHQPPWKQEFHKS